MEILNQVFPLLILLVAALLCGIVSHGTEYYFGDAARANGVGLTVFVAILIVNGFLAFDYVVQQQYFMLAAIDWAILLIVQFLTSIRTIDLNGFGISAIICAVVMITWYFFFL